VKAFVLASSDPPPGVVGPEPAGWLVSTLADAQLKTAQRIARAVVSEAAEVDEVLRAFAKVSAGRRPKGAVSLALPLSGGLSYSWQGVHVGGPVLTVRLETGP
jgi:hypothetical protein